ncbi:MAG TPA: right-handed parallel beta-helix repeat-containing protein [Desulfobaccales bacterium]
MKNWVARLLILGAISFLMTEARAGSWTAHEFIYKPALGARGTTEKNTFDSGLDRVDARLGKQVWVGDPNYGATLQNAITAIGSTACTLNVPAGTHSIAADLIIPTNVHLRVHRGATLAVATTKTLTLNGPLEAGLYQIFSWSGTGKVVFGAGAVKEVYPQWWGAKGDWNGSIGTDNYAALTRALAAHYRVRVPSGQYKVSQPVVLNDDNELLGDVSKPLIINPSTSAPGGWPGAAGYWTNAIQIGNYGGWGNGYGVDAETSYNISTVTPPTNKITLVTAGEASNFAVGDIIFLTSYEEKAILPSGLTSKYAQTNRVVAVNVGTGEITLELPVFDPYTSSAPNYSKIRRGSGNVTGLDGQPAKVVKNCRLVNLTLQTTCTSPMWSATHWSPWNLTVENLEVVTPYAGIGCNPGGRISLKDVFVKTTNASPGLPVEICYLTNNIRIQNLEILSVGTAICGLNLGEAGSDVDVEGLIIGGSYSSYGTYVGKDRAHFRNVRISNENSGGVCWQVSPDCAGLVLAEAHLRGHESSTAVVLGRYTKNFLADRVTIDHTAVGFSLAYLPGNQSYLEDIVIRNCKVSNYTSYGILFGEQTARTRLTGNTFIRKSGSGTYAVQMGTTVHQDAIVQGNVCGAAGARTSADVIRHENADTTVIAKNNVQFTTQSETFNYDTSACSGTGKQTLKEKAFGGATLRRRQGFTFEISGTFTGTNGNKTVYLSLGGQALDTFAFTAAQVGNFRVRGRIFIENNSYWVRCDHEIIYNLSGSEGAIKRCGSYEGTINLAGDFTFKVEGQLANAADTLAVGVFAVLPFNGDAIVVANADSWRREYNTVSPHSELGYRPPAVAGGVADRTSPG